MKTAVILSGQCRTFARTLPNLAWAVFSKLENPHFYASVARDADAGAIELLRERYPKAPIHIEVVEQPNLAEPSYSTSLHAPYAITPTRTPGVGPLQGILRQLWHNSQAWKFAVKNGAADADFVVRCRPDLHFARFEMPSQNSLTRPPLAITPYWGNYGPGVCDRFAVLGVCAAAAYFETYDTLPELLASGEPFHPETLVGASLRRAGCTISRTLLAEFAFCRKPDAQHSDFWFEHMQVLPGELAEWAAHLSKQ